VPVFGPPFYEKGGKRNRGVQLFFFTKKEPKKWFVKKPKEQFLYLAFSI
jgi:hypothetical protein